MRPYDCKKCGAKHGLELKDMITGESEPLDTCYGCMFLGTCNPLKEQVSLNCYDQTKADQARAWADINTRH